MLPYAQPSKGAHVGAADHEITKTEQTHKESKDSQVTVNV